jgi:hypothetical protein
MRLNSAGDLQMNSGYGSVATAYGCRAWVKFNGTGTPSINGSGNVSSITDGGTGVYTVNFTTAIIDATYSAACSISQRGGVTLDTTIVTSSFQTTGIEVLTLSDGTLFDDDAICVNIFR